MKLPSIFSFAKDNTEVVKKESAAAQAGLYNQVAVDELIALISKVPDMDEVLKQAGIGRHRLSVLTYDDEIAQAVETRLDALLGLSFRIEPNDDAQAKIIMDIMMPKLRDIVTGAFQARLYGYSVMEAVYMKTIDGKIGLNFIGEKPMEWFAPQPDGELKYFPNGFSLTDGVLVDQRYKFFMTRSKATYRNPYGDALLSRLYWPWFFRQNGWKFWGKFLERFGAPLLVGKSSKPAEMVQALLMAHSQAVIGVGNDDSVEAVGASSNTGQAFDSFESAILRRIQKVVLGQTLTSGTDGGSGNRALGDVHNNVRADKLESDINLILPTIQRIVDALCELNRFKPMEAIYTTQAGLETGRAKRDIDLYAIGVRFTPNYVKDNYELSDEDFTITEATAPDTTKTDVIPKKTVKASLEWLFSKLTGDSKDVSFTKDQQVVEDVGSEAIANAGSPFSQDLLNKAVFAATSPEDLQERLMLLLDDAEGSVTQEQFANALEEAMRQAQVLGFVQSEV